MKFVQFETRDEWLAERETKITGTTLKDFLVKPRTNGVEIDGEMLNPAQLGLAASFMTVPDVRDGVEWHNAAQRGLFLEAEALDAAQARLEGEYIKMDNAICEDDDGILAVSPDSIATDKKSAVETKCLSNANHLAALLAKKGNQSAYDFVVKQFEKQVSQYKTVIPTIEKVYLAFYNPCFVDDDKKIVIFEMSDFDEESKDARMAADKAKNAIKLIMKGL